MTLVSTNWLNENLNKVKIIDASWHLVKSRNAIDEYDDDDGITVKITNIATGEVTYDYTFPYQEELPDDDDD